MNRKETIIFVHGAWHGKWCWDKYFAPAFRDEGYNVITFDLPGHDNPGKIKGINKYSLKDYTLALESVVAKLDEPPIIIGHSMGGMIVQKYLETNTCKKAILLASVPPFGVIKTTLKFAKHGYFWSSLLSFNLYNLVNSIEKSKMALFSDDMDAEEVSEYINKLCSESFLAFLNMLLPRVKTNKNNKIPILVLGAANDKLFSVRDNEITANKHQADLLIIDDIAHDVMLDTNHKKVSDAILKWLEEPNSHS